jgi:hypothetical protein
MRSAFALAILVALHEYEVLPTLLEYMVLPGVDAGGSKGFGFPGPTGANVSATHP